MCLTRCVLSPPRRVKVPQPNPLPAAQAYAKLVELSRGDLRKAITTMQSTAGFYGKTINPDDVVEMSGVPPGDVCDKLWTAIQSGPFGVVKEEV